MPPGRELGVCFIIFEHLTSISSFEEDAGDPIILTPKVHECSWLARARLWEWETRSQMMAMREKTEWSTHIH